MADLLSLWVEEAECGDIGAAVLEFLEVDHVQIQARHEVVVVRGHHHLLRNGYQKVGS